jgi:hypothetical protein
MLTRTGKTDLREALRAKTAGSSRAENRWPEGLRRVRCLGCDARFVSPQRDARVCAACRAEG